MIEIRRTLIQLYMASTVPLCPVIDIDIATRFSPPPQRTFVLIFPNTEIWRALSSSSASDWSIASSMAVSGFHYATFVTFNSGSSKSLVISTGEHLDVPYVSRIASQTFGCDSYNMPYIMKAEFLWHWFLPSLIQLFFGRGIRRNATLIHNSLPSFAALTHYPEIIYLSSLTTFKERTCGVSNLCLCYNSTLRLRINISPQTPRTKTVEHQNIQQH